MPRVTKPLSPTQVAHAKPKEKEYNLVDGKGLSLRIKPNGTKIWLFNYYHPFTKKRSNISIGLYSAVSLSKAREISDRYRRQLADKVDPKEERERLDKAEKLLRENTLEQVATVWYESRKDRISKNTWRSLELHIFPRLGNKPITDLTAPDAITAIKVVAEKGSYETVRRLCQRLNKIMAFSENTGRIKYNPLANILDEFRVIKTENYPTLKPEELPQLLRRISRASIKITTRNLIEWQLHTMVRPNEAAGTRWDEIDIVNRIWNIPSERMKNKKNHSVPLTNQALELLEEMKPISGYRIYVFPADRNPRTHANASTANMALKRMGYGGVLVAHGLRSIASTTLNENGFDPDVIESALSHFDKNKVRAAYNRAQYLDRRAKLMIWWSDYIEAAARGEILRTTKTKNLRIIYK
ncbi:MAG: integrase domain-containing protein [Enterobacterales bacterium]|nr:integrase domain-containing protein [Enterobacterales bacterium]